MAIKASNQITIIDIDDVGRLGVYLTSSLPLSAIYDPNTDTYAPNWASTNLKITPVLYLNEKALSLTAPGVSITWKRREGAGSEGNLTSGEAASSGILTVSQNKLSTVSSRLLSYICYVTYTDPDTAVTVNAQSVLSYSLLQNANELHYISVDGNNVFLYNASGNLSGDSQLTLTATPVNVTITEWQYRKSDGTFAAYPTTSDNATISGSSLNVKPEHAVFFNDIAVIKVLTNDVDVYDTVTISKLRDGKAGAAGPAGAGGTSVIVGNESQVIPCTSAGNVLSAMDITIPFAGYKGTVKAACSVSVGTLPSGITVKSNTAATASADGSLILTAASGAALGSASAMNGSIDLTFTCNGTTVLKKFTWTKSKAAVNGTNGANAVLFQITSPAGNIIFNSANNVSLETLMYSGTTAVTPTSYVWKKYAGGSWTAISGQTAATLTVTPAMVDGYASFSCTAVYGGKSYTAYATVIDKQDNYSVECISTMGLQIKNGQGYGVIYYRLFQNGSETDPLKSTDFLTAAPANPANGDFYYLVNRTAKTVTLKKYNGTAWVDATGLDLPSEVYHTYRLDKNSLPLDGGEVWKTGKVVYVDGSVIDEKCTFVVEVE